MSYHTFYCHFNGRSDALCVCVYDEFDMLRFVQTNGAALVAGQFVVKHFSNWPLQCFGALSDGTSVKLCVCTAKSTNNPFKYCLNNAILLEWEFVGV